MRAKCIEYRGWVCVSNAMGGNNIYIVYDLPLYECIINNKKWLGGLRETVMGYNRLKWGNLCL